MAFAIKLQTNSSEPIRLDKTLTDVSELSGTLRDECSITDPVIIVEASFSDLAAVNYVTIPAFGRSYFVTGIDAIRSDLCEISLHVDVLSTFATAIRANKAIIHRQENNWNLYLNDGSIRCYENPMINTVQFPGSFDGFGFVLVVSGKRGGGISYQGGTYTGEGGQTGSGNTEGKTTAGLLAYAVAQLGRPYWFGTFGNTATAALYNARKTDYPDYYTATDFDQQYGERVHDCVGIVKGYRWSADPNAVPQYVASQDVNAAGLWAQCNRSRGTFTPATPNCVIGACLFNSDLTHVGVYAGAGKVIEARGHAYGVVETNAVDRTFTRWGIPDWLSITTGGD